jgi:hypothetical protein
MGEMRNAYDILVGKPEGKRSLGRPRRRCVNSVRMYIIREIGWEGMNWMHLAQDRDKWQDLLNTVRLCKRRGIYCLAERLYMELVS